MGDFYVTLQSDSCINHFPENTISNFRNYFNEPLNLEFNSYQVALVDVTYTYTNYICKAGQILGWYKGKQIKSDRNIFNVSDLFHYLSEEKINPRGKSYTYVNPDWKWSATLYMKVGYDERKNRYLHDSHPEAGNNDLFIYCDIIGSQHVGGILAPLLRRMPYKHPDSQNRVYREFNHLQYHDLIQSQIQSIHLYIKNEHGEAPPFEFGPFSATLHFRPKV